MLFEPAVIGKMQTRNRMVRSATYDGMANRNGGNRPVACPGRPLLRGILPGHN